MNDRGRVYRSVWLVAMLLAVAAGGAEPVYDEDRGVWQVMLDSDHQAGPTRVDVLLPDKLEDGRAYPVLYILPVEGKAGETYGSGIAEARKADLANRHQVICVYPSFTTVPWYGDHATDKTVRQESFMLRDLVPWVDAQYPTQKAADGRWLLGFSKSGWGAVTLLLRNPDTFGFAAAWDVPFMIDGEGKDWGPMGLKKVYGDKATMQRSLPTGLAAAHAERLAADRPRLVIGVGAYWKPQCVAFHAFLDEHRVPHHYRPDLTRKHRWDTGWFAPMADDLARIATTPPE